MAPVYKTIILDHEEDKDRWCILIKPNEPNFNSFKEALFNRIPSLKNGPLHMFYYNSSDKVILDTDLDFELCIKTNFHGELYVVKNPRKEIWSQALSSNFEVSTGFIKKGNSNATLPNSAPQEKQTAVPEWKDLIKALGAINRGMEVAQASCTYKVPLHPLCEAMDIIGFPLRRSNDKGEIHNEARLKILQLIETELESLKNNAKTVEKQVKANDALENVEALKLANTPIVPNGAKIDESTQSTDAATVPKALPEKDVTNSEASRNGLESPEWTLIATSEEECSSCNEIKRTQRPGSKPPMCIRELQKKLRKY